MSEYQEHVDNEMLKARSEAKQVSAPESIRKAEAEPQLEPRNRVNEMIDRAVKGDIFFDEPTREDRVALQKAHDESQEPIAIQGAETIEMLFQKARKGDL